MTIFDGLRIGRSFYLGRLYIVSHVIGMLTRGKPCAQEAEQSAQQRQQQENNQCSDKASAKANQAAAEAGVARAGISGNILDDEANGVSDSACHKSTQEAHTPLYCHLANDKPGNKVDH